MASFDGVAKKVRPLDAEGYDGLYFKDLPNVKFRKIMDALHFQDLQNLRDLQNLSEDDVAAHKDEILKHQSKIVLKLFQMALCDEKGESFDEFKTLEDVQNKLGVLASKDILEAYVRKHNPTVKT